MAHKWRGKVPFGNGDKHRYPGRQLHWASPLHQRDQPAGNVVDGNVVWKDWYSFDAALEIDSVRSGNSAKYLELVELETRKRYVLFIADLVALASETTINHGRISGRWGFCKRGQNFGVYWMEAL